MISKHKNEPEWMLEFRLKALESFYEKPTPQWGGDLNEGFSGGEKKRNEILQMLMLDPTLAIMDETDSGLDIDALQVVAKGVNELRGPDFSAVIITHYQRILRYIEPDHVHVMLDGRLVTSGGKELALDLEDKGYEWVRQEFGAGAELGKG